MGRGNGKGSADHFAKIFGNRRGTTQDEEPYVIGEDDAVFERALEGYATQGRRLSAIEIPPEVKMGIPLLFDGKPFGSVWVNANNKGIRRLFYSTKEQLMVDEGTTDEWLNEVLPIIHRLRHLAINAGVSDEIWSNASLALVRPF